LIIAGIVQDDEYFRREVEPHVDGRQIIYIGPVDVAGKNELFAQAAAVLHLNTIPERFGLVLAEANAAGVPVIAMDLGSCREVIVDGITGFLVSDVNEAVSAVARLSEIEGRACRVNVEARFSIERMAESYESVYEQIFERESKRRDDSRARGGGQ
jgi:glycosyltransferase involved in cell wall biosynthesis